MLRDYLPFYEIALRLQTLRSRAELLQSNTYSSHNLSENDQDAKRFRELLDEIQLVCGNHGLIHTSKLAACVIARFPPRNYAELFHGLNHLNDSLSGELQDESIFCIPPQRKAYFERDDLFGSRRRHLPALLGFLARGLAGLVR